MVAEVERQWKEYFELATQVKLATEVHRISTSSNRKVTLHYGDGGELEKSFDIVLVAVGFGSEIGLAGTTAESYWDDIEVSRKVVTNDKKIWVSGTGDGR